MTRIESMTTAPQLNDLFLNFLNRSVDAESLQAEVAALGEVEPHEVAVGFRAEPRMAWEHGLEALQPIVSPAGSKIAPPTEWAGMVVRHAAVLALPFALANYPQRVRELSILVQSKSFITLRPHGEPTENAAASGSLRNWASRQMQKGDVASGLTAVGVLRAAQDYDLALEYLRTLAKSADSEWQAVLGNEEAAILWQRGDGDAPLARWNALPDTPTVLFNRGMAALFLDKPITAHKSLSKAVEGLAETSAWHHLASLYLALAEMRM